MKDGIQDKRGPCNLANNISCSLSGYEFRSSASIINYVPISVSESFKVHVTKHVVLFHLEE